MHPAIPHLIELQHVDHQIAALRAELDTFPKRVQEADAKLSGARAAVTAAKEALAAKAAERKKIEFDVQQWKDRAKKFRDQSGAVKTNEAFHALQHEIANAESEISKAEDRQLELMMAGEEAERGVKLAELRLQDDERVVNEERKQIHSLQVTRKKELETVLAEQARIAPSIPEDLRELYTRIAKRHNGTGMAEVKTDQCRGCGMRVLPHIIQEILMEANDTIYRCESCGLILYSLDPIHPTHHEPNSGSAAASSSSNS